MSIQPPSDRESRRVFDLMFNGLAAALGAEGLWVPLSARMRITAAVYDALVAGDVEVRVKPTAADMRAAAKDN